MNQGAMLLGNEVADHFAKLAAFAGNYSKLLHQITGVI